MAVLNKDIKKRIKDMKKSIEVDTKTLEEGGQSVDHFELSMEYSYLYDLYLLENQLEKAIEALEHALIEGWLHEKKFPGMFDLTDTKEERVKKELDKIKQMLSKNSEREVIKLLLAEELKRTNCADTTTLIQAIDSKLSDYFEEYT